MKVVYDGMFEAVTLPTVDGLEVVRGEPVEVPDYVGKSLCKQPDWSEYGGSETKEAATKKASATKKKEA